MGRHTIKVQINDNINKVEVNPNPLPNPDQRVLAGDTVTWLFDPPRALEIRFLRVRELPNGTPRPCDPNGPFISLNPLPGAIGIEGTIRPGVPTSPPNQRFLYNIYDNDMLIEWVNPLLGEEAGVYGGIDIPMTHGAG
jgi:hypothetical protein